MKEEIQEVSGVDKAQETVQEESRLNTCLHKLCACMQCRNLCFKMQNFWKGASCQRFIGSCKALGSLLKEYGAKLCIFSQQKCALGLGFLKSAWLNSQHRREWVIGFAVLVLILLGVLAFKIPTFYQNVNRVQMSPALYREMSRPLVVKFDETGLFSLIRVKLAFLTRDASIINQLTLHETELKESCVEVLSKEKGERLLTRAGKEALLAHLLEVANQVVHQDTTVEASKKIESVLLQEFVMQ